MILDPTVKPVAAILACLTFVLAGCGTARGEAEYQASIGINESAGGVEALGVAAVTNGEGVATVVGTLVNNTDRMQVLTGVAASSERGEIQAYLRDGDALPVPPGATVQLAPRQAITLAGVDLPLGLFIELRLRFAENPDLHMDIPVEPQSGPYVEVEVTTPPDGDVSPE